MIRVLFSGIIISMFFVACKQSDNTAPAKSFNSIAEKYVRLGLTIGQYDPDFVDAYYGPDSLKPTRAKSEVFPKDSLLQAVKDLQNEFLPFADSAAANDTLRIRAKWIGR